MKSVLVYCGASPGRNPVYKEVAEALGKELVKRNIRLIYGGGSLGLMGVVSDTVMKGGGEVTGIIPNFLDKMEVGNPDLTEIHRVDTMHQRKSLMQELCEGIITLPGGFGSMDELFEILTWAQLGLHQKPVGLLNINGFYNPLILQIHVMVEEGFLRPENRDLLVISDNIEELFEKMDNFQPVPVMKWLEKKGI
jgi:uncharacterized protein (TIGR00730 family)